MSLHSFTTTEDKAVLIDIDDWNYTATVFTDPGHQKIGTLEFRETKGDERSPNTLHLTRAYLDGLDGAFLHQGIGRECVRLMRQETGMEITASHDDGLGQKNDGSHLTGDAPGFVAKMREEGLIAGGERPDTEDDEEDWD